MNWKLVLQLAALGFAMGLGTVFFIPTNLEPIVWLIIFLPSAYAIAKYCMRRRFLHGLLVGLFDSLFKTSVHMMLFGSYVARHSQEIAMIQKMTTAVSPRQLILLSSPVWGLIYSTVIGLLAMLFGKFMRHADVGKQVS